MTTLINNILTGNLSGIKMLFIGTEYALLTQHAVQSGATVYTLSDPTASMVGTIPVRDDVNGWSDEWIPFKRVRHYWPIDVVVSNRLDKAKYFVQIAPLLLTKIGDSSKLKNYYQHFDKTDLGLMLCH